MDINYLFPPDAVTELPTWRFILHFLVPEDYDDALLQVVVDELQEVDFDIITFTGGLEGIRYDGVKNAVSVPIEVSEDERHSADGLKRYESDIWRIMGNMMQLGFGDLYYEAVDWES